MDNELNSKIKEIAETMEEEGIPMINLSRLFIKEPLSLQGLFMIGDNCPMTIGQICEEFICYIGKNVNVTHMLDELKGSHEIKS
jgi:hypothetical protein